MVLCTLGLALPHLSQPCLSQCGMWLLPRLPYLLHFQVVTLPSFEVFYRSSRVAFVVGPQLDQVRLTNSTPLTFAPQSDCRQLLSFPCVARSLSQPSHVVHPTPQIENKIGQFGFVTSKTDFFSDDAMNKAGEKDENGDLIWDRMADRVAKDSKKWETHGHAPFLSQS